MKRFLDDFFAFWARGATHTLLELVAALNAWSVSNGYKVQFKLAGSGSPISFLDLEIYLGSSGSWHTRIYSKTSDVHAFLSPKSCHPSFVVKNIPFGVAIRIMRNCSEFCEYKSNWWRYVKLFQRRGYGRNAVDRAFEYVRKNLRRADLLTKKKPVKKRTNDAVYLFPHSAADLARNALKLAATAYAGVEKQERPFNVPQKVTATCGRNLKQLLVKTAVGVQRNPFGCYPCGGSSCLLDQVLLADKMVVSSATGLAFRIRQPLTCQSNNVIYVITCQKCGLQGVGECRDPRVRLMSYFYTARDHRIPPGSKDCAIHKHFATEHHIEDLKITLVEQAPMTKSRYCFLYMPAIRKRLEKRWIKRLKAVLNHKREVWYLFSGSEASRGEPNSVE